MARDESLDSLRELLLKYKAGDFLRKKLGENAFRSAEPGEMSSMAIRIGLFGYTGAGKSSFVNSVAKALVDRDYLPAVTQTGGGEGTIALETFFHDYGFRLVDTRGFMSMESWEEKELFAILYGSLSDCDIIERGEGQPAYGPGGCNVQKGPLSEQVHVVLWFVKATDVRLDQDSYTMKTEFIRKHLFTLGVNIIPLITFSDKMDLAKKESLTSKAKELCDPSVRKSQEPYFITNYTPENSQNYEKSHQESVLRAIKEAIYQGERSLRSRQIKRSFKK
ncbi:interferon-induced protein 44-like [Ptychodera flava]|uniref:interferon-induced protein 44-like n=1 Tax=Ptychodera flava TaxID=63121 RepID=UPI003969CF45